MSKFKSLTSDQDNDIDAQKFNEISNKERKKTIQILVLCVNCFFGYFPNKLANNTLLYFLDTNTYNVYIAYSNMLIWFSHGIKIFIHLSFDPQYFKEFWRFFFKKKNLNWFNKTRKTYSIWSRRDKCNCFNTGFEDCLIDHPVTITVTKMRL